MSEDAPLKNRLNETILARRPRVENRRSLLRLNLGYVNDVQKEWQKCSEPSRLRNHLGRCQRRRRQVFATRQITAAWLLSPCAFTSEHIKSAFCSSLMPFAVDVGP